MPVPIIRFRVVEDADADFSWLDQDHYKPGHKDYSPIYRNRADMNAGRDPIDPEWYINPDNHAALGLICEKKCGECGTWDTVDSLWSIDFLQPEVPNVGTYHTLKEITDPYLRELAADMRKQAKAR